MYLGEIGELKCKTPCYDGFDEVGLSVAKTWGLVAVGAAAGLGVGIFMPKKYADKAVLVGAVLGAIMSVRPFREKIL